MTPRILLCAPSSGTGKTTVTCAILQALVNRGLHPMACKSGPDYIDPMFHSHVIGAKSCNLDLFFFSPSTARALLRENAADCTVTVLEGAMGYYDGIGMGTDASAWALAAATESPAVLVLDGRGRACSAGAEVAGFLHFRPISKISGVIFNRISPMLYPRMADMVTHETGLPVFGYLPDLPDCTIESRHLGLVMASEIGDLKEKLCRLAQTAEHTLDLDGLLHLAGTAPELTDPPLALPEPIPGRPRIALAQDEAFCFYYADSLKLLEKLGGELVPFSPLHDHELPKNISGLYLGGGYPELYTPMLSQNSSMRKCVQRAIRSGLPTIAECGGFLYLHQNLEGMDGQHYPMAAVLPGDGLRTKRLGCFGYITLQPQSDSLLFRRGEPVSAHEFHYWDSTQPGEALLAQKPQSNRHWSAGFASETLYGGFPHLHFYADPQCAARFVSACAHYQEENVCPSC